jgi:hypothetical protein
MSKYPLVISEAPRARHAYCRRPHREQPIHGILPAAVSRAAYTGSAVLLVVMGRLFADFPAETGLGAALMSVVRELPPSRN